MRRQIECLYDNDNGNDHEEEKNDTVGDKENFWRCALWIKMRLIHKEAGIKKLHFTCMKIWEEILEVWGKEDVNLSSEEYEKSEWTRRDTGWFSESIGASEVPGPRTIETKGSCVVP